MLVLVATRRTPYQSASVQQANDNILRETVPLVIILLAPLSSMVAVFKHFHHCLGSHRSDAEVG